MNFILNVANLILTAAILIGLIASGTISWTNIRAEVKRLSGKIDK